MSRHVLVIIEVRALRDELVCDLVDRVVALRETEQALGKLPRVDHAADWLEQAIRQRRSSHNPALAPRAQQEVLP